jgi:hypothetical protein
MDLVGLAKNKRLNALSAKLQADAATQHQETKEKVRLFGAFQYKAHSWDRQRRVIVKAEHNAHGANPRYVVTNREGEPQGLYEQDYCARGEMENRIKEQQLDLFSDRTSCHEWWREPVPGIALLLCLRASGTAAAHRPGGHRVGAGPSGHPPARNCAKVGAVVVRNTRRVRLWFKVGLSLARSLSPLRGLLLRLGRSGAGPGTR